MPLVCRLLRNPPSIRISCKQNVALRNSMIHFFEDKIWEPPVGFQILFKSELLFGKATLCAQFTHPAIPSLSLNK